MQLYIIRHCQSENNALWQRTGSSSGRLSDPPITGTGQQQARCLADFVAGSRGDGSGSHDNFLDRDGINISHLYCSLMSRAIQTGTYIAEKLDLPLVAREDIYERGGIYVGNSQTDQKNGLAGPNRAYFEQKFPFLILPDSLGAEGWWNRPYEERDEALLRAKSFFDWLLITHDGTEDKVAIVTHAGFIQSLFSVLFDIPQMQTNLGMNRDLWIKFNNGSITRLDFHEEFVRLDYQNRVEFMPDHLVT